MNKLPYRQDLDGLRALAIIPVVLFHAYPNLIKGGFIGVDIFFVISGYLITSILIYEIENNNFGFKNFYARRILRILPSLIFLLVALLIIGYFFLLPIDYELLIKHIKRATTFTSNFLLLRESGYFDINSEIKPLLHLWSLSIEEQFYVIYPLIIWFLYRKTIFIPFVITIFIVSFTLNIIYNESNPVANFYLPITRFWELLAGSFLAYPMHLEWMVRVHYIMKIKWLKNIVQNKDCISFFGILLIFLGFSLITKADPYPGWKTLIPVLGTCLLIFSGSEAIINKKLLTYPVLVWIGLVSYPMYLFHWPVFSIARIWYGESLGLGCSALAIFISILLASLSFYAIERPIRFGFNKSQRSFFIKTVGLSACFVAVYLISGILRTHQAYNIRFSDASQQLSALDWPEEFNWTQACRDKYPAKQYCMDVGFNESISAAIIGDSHANHFYFGLRDWYIENGLGGVINLGRGGCGAFMGVEVGRHSNPCYLEMKGIFDFIIHNKEIKTVYLAFYHAGYFESDFNFTDLEGDIKYSDIYSNIEASLIRTILTLKSNGKKVVLIHDLPNLNMEPKNEVKRCFYSKILGLNNNCRIHEIKFMKTITFEKYETLIANVHSKTGVLIFNPNLYVGDFFPRDQNGFFMYRDSNHLSLEGSKFFSTKYWFNDLKKIN